jgi:hypothetical protein
MPMTTRSRLTARHDRTPPAGLRPLGWALAGLVALSALPAAAQTYTRSEPSGSFRSIASTGARLSFSSTDDGTAALSIPFSFSFFGQPVSLAYASTNGLVSFGAQTTAYQNTTVPSASTPNGFAAAMWTDLELGTGTVYAGLGTASNGGQAYVVEWANVIVLNGTAPFSFQVRLGTDGAIEFAYSYSGLADFSGTVGVEDSLGSTGVGLSCGASCTSSSIPSGYIVRFTPSSGGGGGGSPDFVFVSTPTFPAALTQNQATSVTVQASNRGSTSPLPTIDVVAVLDTNFSGNYDPNDTFIGQTTLTAPAAGSSQSGSMSVVVPGSVFADVYDLFVVLDPFRGHLETAVSNNELYVGALEVRAGGGGGGNITVFGSALPEAIVGQSYATTLSASESGCEWSLTSGSLPPGLGLDPSSGRITGAPLSSGTFSFRVTASKSGFTPGSGEFRINVRGGGGGGLEFTTTSIPPAQVGVDYMTTLQASGGRAPYAFQVVSGAPEWLRLDTQSGALTGRPSSGGTFTIGFAVFDQEAQSAEVTVELVVDEPVDLAWVTAEGELPSAVVGRAYVAALEARGGRGGIGYTIVSGGLPEGLSLGEGGEIAGTPGRVQTASFEVEARDGAGATLRRAFRIAVTELQPLQVDLPGTITLRVNTEANVALRAQGGVAPYSWTVDGGLPAGLFVDEGALRGTPTSTRTNTRVTFRVVDADGMMASKEVRIDVTTTGAGSGGGGTGTAARGGARGGGGCACVAPPVGRDLPWAGLAGLVTLVGLSGRARRRRVFPSTGNRGLTTGDVHER